MTLRRWMKETQLSSIVSMIAGSHQTKRKKTVYLLVTAKGTNTWFSVRQGKYSLEGKTIASFSSCLFAAGKQAGLYCMQVLSISDIMFQDVDNAVRPVIGNKKIERIPCSALNLNLLPFQPLSSSRFSQYDEVWRTRWNDQEHSFKYACDQELLSDMPGRRTEFDREYEPGAMEQAGEHAAAPYERADLHSVIGAQSGIGKPADALQHCATSSSDY